MIKFGVFSSSGGHKINKLEHFLIPTTNLAMQKTINPTPTSIGSLENDAVASPCFITAFPLPFQEVSGHEHGPSQTLCYGKAVPQAESWQSLSHPPSHPDKPLGLVSSLKHHDSRNQGNRQPLPFALPLPSPLSRRDDSTSRCHGDRDSQQKWQRTTTSCYLGNINTVSSAPLPDDFTPRKWSVLVGRDRKCVESPGNKRLHVIVGWYLQRYAKSHDDKEEKSSIISEIESTVRSACQGERGAFVKYRNGRWWEVEHALVREKIGRMLREALHTNYSSSSKQKRAKLRLLRRVSCNEE